MRSNGKPKKTRHSHRFGVTSLAFHQSINYNTSANTVIMKAWCGIFKTLPDFSAVQSPSCLVHCSLYGPTWPGHQPAELWFSSSPSSSASPSLCHHFSPGRQVQPGLLSQLKNNGTNHGFNLLYDSKALFLSFVLFVCT